jgi:hypothetical protein
LRWWCGVFVLDMFMLVDPAWWACQASRMARLAKAMTMRRLCHRVSRFFLYSIQKEFEVSKGFFDSETAPVVADNSVAL